jgi:hypothetical protein
MAPCGQEPEATGPSLYNRDNCDYSNVALPTDMADGRAGEYHTRGHMRTLVMIRTRYELMSSSERFWALFHAQIDALLFIFLAAAIYTGMTSDFAVFYFWAPFLAFVSWHRWKQMKQRWSL